VPVGGTPRSTPRIRALPKILSLHFLLRALSSVKSKLCIALPPELELSPPVSVLWAAVGSGVVLVPDKLSQGELAAFEPSNETLEFEALSDAEFVLGSAVPHNHDLVLGDYSVHTNLGALRAAQARISVIRASLIREGRL